MSSIQIKNIPTDHKYEGYVWMSNSSQPDVYDGRALPADFGKAVNPFVIEAELWDSSERTSYSIHQAGNTTICQRFIVVKADFDNPNTERKVYASQRMDERQLTFLEYWEPDNKTKDNKSTDNNDRADCNSCLGMPALAMTKRVFVGFNKKEEAK